MLLKTQQKDLGEYFRTWLELLSELGKNISIDRDPRVALLTLHPELPVSVCLHGAWLSWGTRLFILNGFIFNCQAQVQVQVPRPNSPLFLTQR